MMLYKIREALEDRRVDVVSKRTGISPRTISNVKNCTSTPNKSTLLVLAAYLGVKDDE